MKEEIRSIVRNAGADVCGFADAADFADAPAGFRPADIFAACRSVIAFGVALPRGVFRVDSRIVYGSVNAAAPARLDDIAARVASAIERRFGALAVPVPSDGPYDQWDEATLTGHGLLSVKHLAAKAGIGAFGKSGLLISPRYGTRLNLGAVLTDLPLSSDPPCGEVCLKTCRKCIDGCPVSAIGEDGSVNQTRCRPFAYGVNTRGFDVVLCNRCRARCAMADGREA